MVPLVQPIANTRKTARIARRIERAKLLGATLSTRQLDRMGSGWSRCTDGRCSQKVYYFAPCRRAPPSFALGFSRCSRGCFDKLECSLLYDV